MALKSCCCGCSVKTGSLIVGYLFAVLAGIGIFLCILAMIIIGGISMHDPEDVAMEYSVHMVKEVLSKVYLIGAVICLKALIVNCLLIHGIYQRKPALVLPWVIFYAAGMVIKMVLSCVAAGLTVNVPAVAFYVCTTVTTIFFGVEIYILIVVSSHYHNMKKKSSLLDEEQIMM